MKKFTLFSAVTLVAAMSVSAAPIGQRTHLPGTGRSLEAEMTAAPYVAGSQLTELPPCHRRQH